MKKNIIFYALSTALNKGSILLFFPLLTQFLTLEEFGQWSLVIIVSNLLIPIVSLNGSASILREGSHNLKIGFSLFKKYIYFSFLISAVIVSIVYFFMGINWFFYSLLIAFSEALLFLGLTYIRIKEQALKYLFISFLKTVAILFLILYVRNSQLSLDILLFYHFSVVLLFAISLIIYLFVKDRQNNLQYNFMPILLFGIVLIPHGLSQWIMSSSDRLILEYTLGSKSVGIYSLAYNISMILMLVNSGIALALPTFIIKNYENWKTNNYDNKFIKYYSYVAIFLFVLILCIYQLDFVYFHILGYYGNEMIPLITVIYLSIYILGLYYFFANYLFYYKKAAVISKTTFYAATLNVILTVIFIMFFHLIGAAIATLLAYTYYLYRIRIEAIRVEDDLNIALSKNLVFVFVLISTISSVFYFTI